MKLIFTKIKFKIRISSIKFKIKSKNSNGSNTMRIINRLITGINQGTKTVTMGPLMLEEAETEETEVITEVGLIRIRIGLTIITKTITEEADTNNEEMVTTIEDIEAIVETEVATTIIIEINTTTIKTTRPTNTIKTQILIKKTKATTSRCSKETEVEATLATKTTEMMTSNIILDRREITIVNIRTTKITMRIRIHFTGTLTQTIRKTMMVINITAIIIRIIRNKFDNQD